ncbi:uncharacterized protein [Anoplolepis gracilipes]|uniref:uncharacterized protein n=1 Tax=Anoplolepis gracilipes TaxID=354296 RepID=UPI003BA0248F
MRRFAIVMLGLISLVSAKPAFLSIPLTYTTSLRPGTQVGTSRGQTLDSPKDSVAHLDEWRSTSANEAERSVESQERESSRLVSDSAPLGVDGRVVDTPEVVAAKAAHVAAHVNEHIKLASEAARSDSALDSLETSDVRLTDTVIDSNGRALHRPEVAREMINLKPGDPLARLVEGSAVPLVLGNGVVAALVPVGLDGRSVAVPETVVTRSDQNPVNDVKSVNALAVAGPALAYGRLTY